MDSASGYLALIAAVVLIAPSGVAAAPAEKDASFDEQAQAVQEGIQLKQDAGVFGRPGDIPGEEGPSASAVGDRDLDRYVERLGFEIRMRNAISDRDVSGFR